MREIVRSAWHLMPRRWRSLFWLQFEKRIRSRLDFFCGFSPLNTGSYKRIHTDALAAGPLVVAGLFRSASGLGEAARSTYRALHSAGLSPIAVDVTKGLTTADFETDIPLETTFAKNDGTLILHVNAPETIYALKAIGIISKHRRINKQRKWRVIGYWAWELPHLPKSWRERFRFVSEIWTLSNFTAEVIRAAKGAPVVTALPIAVEPPNTPRKAPHGARALSKGSENPVVFLTMADANSSIARKNPVAAINAFRIAFGNEPDRHLIVKTRNYAGHDLAARLLRDAISDAPNISVIDAPYTEDERWGLIAAADILVSLHRAEGFGLPCAEAMSIGKAVISTAYSGNLSFMDENSAALVPYRLVPVEDPTGIYGGKNQQWAEPNIEAAADMMRRLANDEAARKAIGAAAKDNILEICNPVTIGARMKSLLQTPRH